MLNQENLELLNELMEYLQEKTNTEQDIKYILWQTLVSNLVEKTHELDEIKKFFKMLLY